MLYAVLILFFFSTMVTFYYFVQYMRIQKRKKKLYSAFKVEETDRHSILLRAGDRFDHSSMADTLTLRLQQADLKIKPSEFMLIFLLVFFGMWALNNRLLQLMFPLDLLVAFAFVYFGSKFLLSSRKNKRLEKLNAQLPEICRLMSNSLKAGLTIQQGLQNCAKDLKEPAKVDFDAMVKELEMGEDLEAVLERFRDKVQSSDVNIFVGTLLIQKQVGGNLGEILDMMAQTLESRARAFKEVRAATAEGESIAYILPIMPIIMCVFMSFIIPGFLNPLFTMYGLILLAIVGGLIFSGLLIVKRLTNIKV